MTREPGEGWEICHQWPETTRKRVLSTALGHRAISVVTRKPPSVYGKKTLVLGRLSIRGTGRTVCIRGQEQHISHPTELCTSWLPAGKVAVAIRTPEGQGGHWQ
jgi:hypothetical protein